MRIELTVDGGFAYFPGLSRPVTIDTESLPEADAAEVMRLVREARLSDQPAAAAPSPGSADHRTYTVTVEDGDHRHTVQVSDPIGDPDLAALVSAIQTIGRRQADAPPPDRSPSGD